MKGPGHSNGLESSGSIDVVHWYSLPESTDFLQGLIGGLTSLTTSKHPVHILETVMALFRVHIEYFPKYIYSFEGYEGYSVRCNSWKILEKWQTSSKKLACTFGYPYKVMWIVPYDCTHFLYISVHIERERDIEYDEYSHRQSKLVFLIKGMKKNNFTTNKYLDIIATH